MLKMKSTGKSWISTGLPALIQCLIHPWLLEGGDPLPFICTSIRNQPITMISRHWLPGFTKDKNPSEIIG